MTISKHPNFDLFKKPYAAEYKSCVAVTTDLKPPKAPVRFLNASISTVLVVGIRHWMFSNPATAVEFINWARAEGFTAVTVAHPMDISEKTLLGV